MQFVCNSCKAKYTISADRVSGKVLKIRCRECGEIIEIRGDGLAAGTLLDDGGRKKAQSSKDLSDKYKVSSLRDKFKESFAAKGAGQLPTATGPRHEPPGPPPSPKPQRPAAPVREKGEVPDPKRWYVSMHNQPVGPISKTRVRQLLKKKELVPGALVWREGLDDWKPLDTCDELSDLIQEIADQKPSVPEREEAGQDREPAAPPGPVPPPIPVAKAAGSGPAPGPVEPDAMRGFSVGRIDAGQTVAEIAEAQANLTHDIFRPAALAETEKQGLVTRLLHSRLALLSFGALAVLLGFGVTMLVINMRNRAQPEGRPAPLVAAAEEPALDHSERGDILAGLTITLEDVITEELQEAKTQPEEYGNGSRPKKKSDADGGKSKTDGTQPLMPLGIKEKTVSASGAGSSLGAGKGGGGTGKNGLSDDQIRATVKKNSNAIKKCYEKVLGKGMGVEEDIKVKVNVNVGGSGMVTKAKVTEISNFGNFLTPCIEGAIKVWMFPSSGSSSEFVFPILLTPKQ